MIEKSELHALADNELSEQEAANLKERLDGNSRAQAEYLEIIAMKSALRATAHIPECESLWKACQGRLDEIDKTRRVEAFVGRYSWGICGVFFLAIAVGGILNRSMMRPVQPNEVAAYMAGLSPMSVPRNQAELNPALKQIMGETFANRPATMTVTALGSNRQMGRRTEFVQLSDAFGSVAVVALLDVKEVGGLWDYEQDRNFKCARIDGANAMCWSRDDGVICMLIGQRSYSELHAIIQAMCSENNSKQ